MKIAIIVFSGTGNTLYVSQLLANELQTLGAIVHRITLGVTQEEREETQRLTKNVAAYDLIGIAFPVLGFGAPANVLDFVKSLPLAHTKVFLFKSAADNHQVNNAASEALESILALKGYDVFHDFLYMMPCNFMVSYPKVLNFQMIDTAKKKALFHARELMEGKRAKLHISKLWHLIARWGHFLESQYGRVYFGMALHASSSCTLCLTCVKHCPAGNIKQEGQVLIFHNKCLFCMRCIYQCPSHAIEAKKYQWCIIKEGYTLASYLNTNEQNRVFITQKSRGFWSHFRCYFDA